MRKITCLTALYVIALSLSCCQKHSGNPIDDGTISYDGINLHFHTSDSGMNEFLNDFTRRNMRYDNYSVGSIPVGNGTGFQKNWETMAISFQNSVAQVYREDKFKKISNYLISCNQDDQGLIYNTPLEFEDPYSYASDDAYEKCHYSVPQGWPFPYWEITVENADNRANLRYVHTIEFNFNDSGHPASQGWTAENGTFNINGGYGNFASNSNVNDFTIHRPNINTLLTRMGGIDSAYAPMIDIEIEYTGSNVADYEIAFKVAGDDSWHYAPQRYYASTPNQNVNGHVHVRQFFDIYLCEEWNHQIITDLGVRFVAQEGKTMTITGGKINFMRPSPDTRQTMATYQYILAMYNYYIFTRDTELLLRTMNKARRGILFLTHALKGAEGLLSIEYFYGHDGVIPYSVTSRPNDRLAYHGIANGYWDLNVYPQYNFETNVDFYQVLKAMAVLEDAASREEADDKSNISVKNRMPLNPERIYYNYDADSLNALADQVKVNIEKPIGKVAEEVDDTYNAGDYHYRHQGGFYNPETGRFAVGINECTGELLDLGYTYLNMEAIACGVGTEEQQLSIMKWIDGQRIISADKSTGKDIYFYEFAARANTKDTDQYLNFYRDENNVQLYREGFRGKTWSRSVQNGGAIIAWSYFDLIARAKVLGVNNALKRLAEMKKWYKKILKDGGDSYYFYSTYYDDLEMQLMMEDPDMLRIYRIQTNQTGSLGLDHDFIESAILIRAIPDAVFGMDASGYNNISFTYPDNKQQEYFEIYNMKFGDAVYSVRSKKNVMEVFNIQGIPNHEYTVTFKYKTTKSNLTVKANGKKVETTYKDGYIYVTVPFDQVKVVFG